MTILTPAPAKVTERVMLDALNIRYDKNPGNGPRYVRAEHVRDRIGFDARRTVDYIALDLAGTNYGPLISRGPFLHGHEVKVSRADWLTELRDSTKAEAFKQHMHFWWLVISDKSFVRPGELPEGWGLMSLQGAGLRVVVQAPKLIPIPMTPDQYGALLRATAKTAHRIGSAATA